jgi:hypothetical protein
MTDFIINDYILDKECNSLAHEIFDNMLDDMASDETPDDYRDTMSDRAHEYADGHEWVIYYYKAVMLCAHCNIDQGEEFLENTGMPETPTFQGLATIIAYGEILARIETVLNELVMK